MDCRRCASGSAERPVVTRRSPVPQARMAGRVRKTMQAGNEVRGHGRGVGRVLRAAQALLGKVVAAAGGGMYENKLPATFTVTGRVQVVAVPGAPSRGRRRSKAQPRS